jgi:uncharacterized protein DUF223
MLATIGKATLSYHSESCEIGKSYFMSMFSVSLSIGDYRPTRHEWKITIWKTTIIDLIPDITTTGKQFNFVPFDVILDNKHDDKYLLGES